MTVKPTSCPTCKKVISVNTIKVEDLKPEQIYKRVLEIGSECITCGISFNNLMNRLKIDGFDFDENGCLERCLREWFWSSFFHEEAHCEHSTSKDNVTKLNDHLNCNFILRADSCMKLLSFKEAELNSETAQTNNDTSKTGLKIAKITGGIAFIGLVISIATLGYALYNDSNDQVSQLDLLQEQQKQTIIMKSTIDSLNINLYKLGLIYRNTNKEQRNTSKK